MSSKGAAADIANQRQTAQNTLTQYLAQLIPGSPEYLQLQNEGGAIVQQVAGPADEEAMIRELGAKLVATQQQKVASGEAVTPLEARTNAQVDQLKAASQNSPFEEDIWNTLLGKPTTTPFGEQLAIGSKPSVTEQDLLNALGGQATTTPIGQLFASTIGRANAPTMDDSLFQNLLKQVEDKVNVSAANRGILGGGLRLEQLGRAGTDAAVAEAYRQDALRQQAYANALGLFDTGRNTTSLYRDVNNATYNAGEALRQRQIGLQGDLVNLQLGRESNLTGILNANQNTRLNDLTSLLQQQTSRAQTLQDYQTQQDAANNALLGKALTYGAGYALAPFTGGASIPLATGIAGAFSGSPTSLPQTAGQLIQSQQQQSAQTGQSQPLSRQGWDAYGDIFKRLLGQSV